MAYDKHKLKAVVLYVIWRTGHYKGFGATKLNKVLWFSDARGFQALGSPITGETYIRHKFGPVPQHIGEICDELESDGLIAPWTEAVFEFHAKRYRAFAPPNTTILSGEQLSLIDWWIKHVAEEHTASSISELSHDYAWELAAMGEEIPMHAFLASRIRPPRDGAEADWARSEAERLGLK
jgi:hypothetical protein